MVELLTSVQMRRLESTAIESGDVSGLELMERAGRGVVDAVFEQWPELECTRGEGGSAPRPADSPRGTSGKMKSALVLCGPGNNGGDGFVVARLLQERGWRIDLYLYGDASKLPPDARVNYERWLALGKVRTLTARGISGGEKQYRLIIDALFGTGLTRGLGDELSDVVKAVSDRVNDGVARVSVDIPSGLCADSGRQLRSPDGSGGAVFTADLTVTFQARKLGHVLNEGPALCGRTVVVSIGLGEACVGSSETAEMIEGNDVLAREVNKHTGHKYSYGHAVVLSGPSGQTGAARLAARGALRVGAGLVTLGVPHDAQAEVASQITAVMMREIGDARALEETLTDARLNAICLGPGLGRERARELVPVALAATREGARRVVLDADALSAYEEDPEELFALLDGRCVLTPHTGEFARLFPDIAERLEAPASNGPAYSKVDAVRKAAARTGSVVLLKGADTVIASPEGRCVVHSAAYEREVPWLATAGSGDVLAGYITGLLARGFPPMRAASVGAWLHVECARAFGPGLIAEDLPEMLPDVFRGLGL